MAYNTNETINRYWQQFFRDQLPNMSDEERRAFEQEFERRFEQLTEGTTGGGNEGFLNLVGFGRDGVVPFGQIAYPRLKPDFTTAVIPSQLHAAAEL